MATIPSKNSIEYRRARKQARAIRGFYIHLAVYCVTIPVLIAINLTFVPDFYWFPFSMLGWGIGVAFHAMEVYKFTPFLGRNWEQKKIRQFIEEEKARLDKINSHQKS